ncbi:MAG: metallophosphoesterase [Tepidisphaeraceae bacterium]
MRWVIGDIHGMLAPLDAILQDVERQDVAARFYFSGDYVNRGPDSRRVIDRLLALPAACVGGFVRGNHDDIFDLLLHGSCYVCHPNAIDPIMALRWFLEQGLDRTFLSYGIDHPAIDKLASRPKRDKLEKALHDHVPDTHRRFISNLRPVIEEDDLFVAHAMWDADEPTTSPNIKSRLFTDEYARRMILWGRFNAEDLTRPKAWGRPGYFGHTPVVNYAPTMRQSSNVPIVAKDVVLLDTGAALGAAGRLSAYCVEEKRFVQADRDGRIVPVGNLVPD